ncbi:MAG: hypothetical protein SynsKO_29720 [Synoicihabitans sp.]
MFIRKSPASLVAFLQGKARGEIVLSLFVLTTAVYLVMILGTIPHVQGFAPGVALFDLSPTGYSHEHAKFLLGSLGAEGRSVYLFPQLAMDFIYPGLFAISYSLKEQKRGRSKKGSILTVLTKRAAKRVIP